MISEVEDHSGVHPFQGSACRRFPEDDEGRTYLVPGDTCGKGCRIHFRYWLRPHYHFWIVLVAYV